MPPKKPSKVQRQAYIERKASCLYWIKHDKIKFPPNLEFDMANFMFQVYLFGAFPLPADKNNFKGIQSRIMGGKKAAQIGITVWAIATSIHGLKYGLYPNGVIHLFPTDTDAQYISKTKVSPFIDINPNTIRPFIGKVDEVGARQIGDGYYYMRGASQTRQIDGQAGSSSKAKSITGDRLIYDEFDEMDMDMVELFKKRVYASKRKEEVYISTPTLPDYGIDKKYNESNQCMWVIKCSRCGKDTILEMEFPEILIEDAQGRVHRICKHCRKPLSGRDIASGQWVPQYPSRTRDSSMVWISSLAVPNRDPSDIYKGMHSTDPIVLKNLYNSDLAMPYLQSEDALTKQDIFACCGPDAMQIKSFKSNAMGVDVKSDALHVIVGHPIGQKKHKILYIARLNSFHDLYDLARRMNVGCVVIDYEPETRKVREFRQRSGLKVYMIDYQERLKASKKIDEVEGILTVRRTETMDKTVNVVKEGRIEFPRRNDELNVYANEMTKTVKVLQEDKMTGSRRYVWKKIGPEHYFHATGYFIIACEDHSIQAKNRKESTIRKIKKKTYDPFDAVRGER